MNIFKKINDSETIVLILHVNPDADSFGSASAFYSYILRIQKNVTLFCVTPSPDKRLALLPWFDKIRDRFPRNADLALCFDCGSKKRLGIEVPCELINIDHHVSNDNFGSVNIVNSEAISTTQVVYDLFKEANIKINAKMATALYAGLVDDSNSFTHAKTDVKSFEMALDLLRCGAEHHSVNKELLYSNSLASLRLKGILFSQMRLRCNASVAVLHVNLQDLERSGALPQDAESVLEEVRTMATVRVSILLRERKSGGIKGSLRGDGCVNMSKIAAYFGGGGHYNSAGFIDADGTLCALEEKIITILCEEMD